jgi:hypothetical protein
MLSLKDKRDCFALGNLLPMGTLSDLSNIDVDICMCNKKRPWWTAYEVSRAWRNEEQAYPTILTQE